MRHPSVSQEKLHRIVIAFCNAFCILPCHHMIMRGLLAAFVSIDEPSLLTATETLQATSSITKPPPHAAFTLDRIDHVALHVKDLPTSASFYKTVFGFD